MRVQGGTAPFIAEAERRACAGGGRRPWPKERTGCRARPGVRGVPRKDESVDGLPGSGLDEKLDVDRRVGDLAEGIADRPGVGGLDPLSGHLMGDRETEHAVLQVESLDAGQPRAIGGIAQLGAEQAADGLPEIVGRLGSELFFHRGIHRCGQQGGVRRTGAVVHEVAQQQNGRDFGEVRHPSEEARIANLTPGCGWLKPRSAELVVPRPEGDSYTPGRPGRPPTCRGPVHHSEESMGEANLSAQEAQADAHPRLSGPDVDPGWPSGAQGAAAEGPSQAERLIWRIRDRATFDALATGRRRRRGPISMTFLPGDPSVPPRVAYAVGKRVGPAVVRNRVRRRLRSRGAGPSGRSCGPAAPTCSAPLRPPPPPPTPRSTLR